MGDIFAYLFLFGLVLRPALYIGSIVLVYFLARRITLIDPGRLKPVTAIIVHIVIMTGVGLLLEVLGGRWRGGSLQPWLYFAGQTLALTLVPGFLYRDYRKLTPERDYPAEVRVSEPAPRPPVLPVREKERADPVPIDPGEVRTARFAAWSVGLSGVLVPWLAGIGVKLYLQSMGHPTWPISSFLQPGVLFVILGSTLFLWSSPFVILAFLIRYRVASPRGSRTFRDGLWLAGVAYLGGMGAAMIIFPGVFWDFDILYLFIPIGLFIAGAMLLGYSAGLLALRFRRSREAAS